MHVWIHHGFDSTAESQSHELGGVPGELSQEIASLFNNCAIQDWM